MKIKKLNMGEIYRRETENLDHTIQIDMELQFKDPDEATNFHAKLIDLLKTNKE